MAVVTPYTIDLTFPACPVVNSKWWNDYIINGVHACLEFNDTADITTKGSITVVGNERIYFNDTNSYIGDPVPNGTTGLVIYDSSRLNLQSPAVYVGDGATATIPIVFNVTDGDGSRFQWESVAGYFQFYDDILIRNNEKMYFRDTALSIHSDADTFIDYTADGAHRFAGAVTMDSTLTVSSSATTVTFEDTNSAPSLLLYNSVATPAADTNIGELTFRGKDDGGTASDYAKIAGYVTNDEATNEDGYMVISTVYEGSLTTAITINPSSAVDFAYDVDIAGDLSLSGSITLATNKKVVFRDSALSISSVADTFLDYVADGAHRFAGAVTMDTSLDIGSSVAVTGVLDEDTMSSDSNVKLCTQQSIKAYVDSQISGGTYWDRTGTILSTITADDDVTIGNGHLIVDTTTLVVNASGYTNKIGMGIATPDGTCHVHTATAGAITPSTSADDLIVENSADCGISILSPDASSGQVHFGTPSDPTGASVSWSHDTNLMVVGTQNTGGTLAFRVDDSLNALTIDANKDATFAGSVTISGNENLYFNDTNSYIGDAVPNGVVGLVISDTSRINLSSPSIYIGDGTTNNVLITGDVSIGELTTTEGRIKNTTRIISTDSPYTALATDHAIFVDTDGGAITVNLPAGVDGTEYQISNCGSSGNDVTVDGSTTETINGSLTQTLNDDEAINIIFETTENWRVF